MQNPDCGPSAPLRRHLPLDRRIVWAFVSAAVATLTWVASPTAHAFQLVPLSTFGTNGNGTIRPGDFDSPWLTSDGARYQRGMAYNPTTGHLIIVNRYPIGFETINIIDAFTGEKVGTLDVCCPSFGGSADFTYNMVGVAEDGAIYVGNLNTVSSSVTFNLYRWANETSQQTLVYFGDPRGGATTANGRWGDAIAVRGAGINTEVLISSRGTQAAILRPTDASMASFTATTLNTDVPTGAIGYGLSFGVGNTFYGKEASAAGNPLYRLSYDLSAGTATTLQVYPVQNFPGRVGPLAVQPANNLLAAIEMTSGTAPDRVRLYDVATPANPPVFLDRKDIEVWTNANNIFSGAVAFGSTNVYALNSDNGIVAYTIATSESALPPLIFGDPASRIVQVTSNTVFTVGADGATPLSYQWRFNDEDIADATDAALSLTNVGTTNGGNYSVVVTNNYGAVTSAVAVLTVLPNFGDLLVYDPFAYAVGTILPGQGEWTVTSANANGAIQAGNLTVPGLAVATGNRYTWTNTSSVRKPFGQYSAGEVYCSFAYRLDTAPTGTGNETTAGFSFGTSTVFPLKINILGVGAGGYQIGLYKGGGTAGNGQIDDSQTFTAGQTVFLVARYVFRAGANADTCDLWINPNPSTFGAATPPTATLADIGAGVSQTWTFIDRFFWRWGTAGYPNRVADELRVGFSWAEVTPPAPPALSIALSGANAVISWPTNTSAGYVLEDNAQVENSEGWEPVAQSPVVAGDNYAVTLGVGGARYFRLKK